MIVSKICFANDNFAFYRTSEETVEIVSAIDSVSEILLRERASCIKRLEKLGCSYVDEMLNNDYDDWLGTMIEKMKTFLHNVQKRSNGIFVTVG